ncbi:hypothetical protein [Nocardioides zhouii]|uniref:AbiEi antitoxin C-terminal domain-containing protein n=1 Tax=Nocardioides zhouii TaxID=1168729 RepID=A0A4Q2SHF0_9ACTN|nr:hypothetical protein [Nocardioides zhouii]RYC04473.1 hypothetical protein EUA94_20665 [Nocardioides zhouii]
MDEERWVPGAWPLRGLGPREGLLPDLVWPVRRHDAGGPTDWQTRSGAFRPVGGGLWVPSGVEQTVGQRIVEAVSRLPAHGAVTGWAALGWLGARWFEGIGPRMEPRPVTLALGSRHTLRPDHHIEVSQELVPAGAIRRVRGIRVTSPLWSVAFEMRKARSDEEAVVAFEMAAYDDLVSVAELAEYVDSALWIRQGVARVRELLANLEENSWSPREPVMRRTWQESGFGRPLANCPVFDLAGRFVGTPDLLDVQAGVYGMYDGGLHLAGAVRHVDVAKEAAYRALGLEGATMMAGDLADRDPFRARLGEAYARAGRRPPESRLWLPGLPDWWTPTFTVDQRRGLSVAERSRVLRYRRAS